VADPVKGSARQRWSLTQEAFDGLLSTLDPDRDTAAGRYIDLRRNLVRLFEWRGCPTPDEYADETINRCAKKIGEGEEIRDLASYSIGVARMLILEMGRDRARNTLSLEEAPEPRVPPPEPEEGNEVRVECLRGCLGQLSPETQDLILRYYRGEKGEKIKNRKGLTQLFGIPANVLRMRALRVRERLQLCVQTCMQGQKKEFVTISGNPAV
jgi:DNA-directed RNA polymerase specialized sigma24 family protein